MITQTELFNRYVSELSKMTERCLTAEYERDENKKLFISNYERCCSLEAKIEELQKQVEELKKQVKEQNNDAI